jgi:hypothetical protein
LARDDPDQENARFVRLGPSPAGSRTPGALTAALAGARSRGMGYYDPFGEESIATSTLLKVSNDSN